MKHAKWIMTAAALGIGAALTCFTWKITILWATGAIVMWGLSVEPILLYYKEPKGQRNKWLKVAIAYPMAFAIFLHYSRYTCSRGNVMNTVSNNPRRTLGIMMTAYRITGCVAARVGVAYITHDVCTTNWQ